MDVVLWNSGAKTNDFTAYRSLGSYKIAHTVRQAGYSAQVIDHVNLMSREDLFQCTTKFIDANTKILGISTTFLVEDHILPPNLISILNSFNTLYPNLEIVFGGYSVMSSKVFLKYLNKKNVSIIPGYGEDIFLDLLHWKAGKGTKPFIDLNDRHNRINEYKTAINTLYNLECDNFKFTDQDCILPNETLPIEISRGCIFKCKFCNHLNLGRKKLDYLRDFELVKEEMLHNYAKWGTTNYYIICDTFNDTEYKMKAWYDMVNSLPFKIKYTAYLRADLLDKFPDVPYMLKDTGLFTGFHGIESLGREASTIIGKGWSGKSAREFIPKLYHDIWKDEVHQTLSFIVGLPGDTRESILDMMAWFKDNDLYHQAVHMLGIYKAALNRHPSEFDLNTEKYGFSFPDETDPTYWETGYWNSNQVVEFIKTDINPIWKDISAPHGSWQIMMMLQYNIDPSLFKKDLSRWIDIDDLKIKRKAMIQNYISKLLAL